MKKSDVWPPSLRLVHWASAALVVAALGLGTIMVQVVHDPADVEVLTGSHGVLRWRVRAGGTPDELTTMLQVFDGDRCVEDAGFGGPALHRRSGRGLPAADRIPTGGLPVEPCRVVE